MFKHKCKIPIGERGEISKILEELEEYKDADFLLWKIIELSDVAEAVYYISWRKHRIPSVLLFSLTLLRFIYKPIRNFIYDSIGWTKEFCLRNNA